MAWVGSPRSIAMQLFGKSCRKVAPRSFAVSDEAIELAHRAGRQIVQHDERVRLREAEPERAFNPAFRVASSPAE